MDRRLSAGCLAFVTVLVASQGCGGGTSPAPSPASDGSPGMSGSPAGSGSGSAPAPTGSTSSSGPGSSSGSGSGSSAQSDAGPGSDAGVACGCDGTTGCAVWMNVYVSWYGFNDNSCTVESQHDCDTIAYPGLGPKMHQVATEGTGTYGDPITAAASDQGSEAAGGATLSPGTIIYNPEVQKYFIMEDSCLECGDEWKCQLSANDTDDPQPPAGCQPGTNLHIDFWMGPDFQQDATNLNTCEDNATLGAPYGGIGTVVVNPPPSLPVKTAPLYTGMGAGGSCWTSQQANAVSCP